MGNNLFNGIWDTTRPAWAIPDAKFRVLFVMAGLADDDTGELIETVGRVADLAGISERQAMRHLAILKEQGFVTILRPGRGQGVPNVYRVTIPSGWQPTRTGAWWEVPADN